MGPVQQVGTVLSWHGVAARADDLKAFFASVAAAFAKEKDLAWSDQVTCVATPPAHRQLAVLAAALLGAKKPTVVFASSENLPANARVDRKLVSDDADMADRQVVEAG